MNFYYLKLGLTIIPAISKNPVPLQETALPERNSRRHRHDLRHREHVTSLSITIKFATERLSKNRCRGGYGAAGDLWLHQSIKFRANECSENHILIQWCLSQYSLCDCFWWIASTSQKKLISGSINGKNFDVQFYKFDVRDVLQLS